MIIFCPDFNSYLPPSSYLKLKKLKENNFQEIKKIFEEYKKNNNLNKLKQKDKINILKQLNYSDEEINIILRFCS